MTLEENKELIRRYAAEVLTGERYDKLDVFLAPDFVDHRGSEAIRGTDELQKQMTRMHQSFSELDFQVVDMIAEGDTVVVHFRVPGIHHDTFAGIPATGQPVVWKGVMIYRIEDGKIIEGLGYWNDAEVVASLKE